LLTRW